MGLFNILEDLLMWSRLVSSAKWCTCQNIIAWHKSFIYFGKSEGPISEPCGTPYVSVHLLDLKPLMVTLFSVMYIVSSNLFAIIPHIP